MRKGRRILFLRTFRREICIRAPLDDFRHAFIQKQGTEAEPNASATIEG